MIITFIYPAVGRKKGCKYISSWKMEPLPIMTVAALTPPDVEIKYYDDRLEKIDYDHKTDLVAINIETYSALRAYNIAAEFKKRGVPVVFGGYHATLMPEEAVFYGNSVIVGEAEGVWPELIQDAKEGKTAGDVRTRLRKFYKSPSRPVFGDIRARRDFINGKKYTRVTLVETSRGCRFACNFCSIKAFYSSTYNFRTTESVIREIEMIGKKTIFFVDDNIISDLPRARELFKALIPLKITWVSQFSIDMADDEVLLRLMKRSGCKGLLIGFESLNRENLKQMDKAWNRRVDYSLPLKKLRDNGLCIYATFVFGFDNDSVRSFQDTLEFALENRFYFAAFNHLTPFPGTQYYRTLEKENRLLYNKWWLDPEYTYGKIAFKPMHMTAEELELKCIEARNKFYGFSSIIKRGLDFKTNSSSLLMSTVFWNQNIRARSEVMEKWGLPLGKNLDTEFK